MSNRLLVALGAAMLAAAPLAAQDTAAAAPAPRPFTAAEEAHYLELGKAATHYFFDGQADSLLAMMDSTTRDRVGGLEGIRQQMDLVAERGGVPLNVLAEKMTRRNGTPQFWYEAEFSTFTNEPLVFRWLFNEDDRLVGAGMGPKSAAPFDGKP